jgi:hypothetical protein
MAKSTKPTKSLTQAVSEEIKSKFNLNNFREQKWIPFSEALQEALSIPGVPLGHITLLRGHTDTGKSTTIAETATKAQKMGILPVFIITEMKFNWEFFINMGFELEKVLDKETNEIIDYKGFFLFVDRSTITTIENMASFILDILDEQKKGNLPYDLLFLIDSIGSIPCNLSVEANKNNAMWNAGAYSQQFGNFVNQKFPLSRKEDYPYTNTLICVNKVWVAPATSPMAQPKMKNKGGDTMWYDSSLVITFGNISNSGTSKLSAVKDGKEVEFAKRVKISCDKNHITGITTKGKVIMTPDGFILDNPASITKYKKAHKENWNNLLGGTDFELVENKEEWEEDFNNIPILGEEYEE